ncbi:hypothetical protein [Indioceanicola profundi]|uniref:hypothetical protein n=1 Tax=Indioceanicola profundi TaxID=2220096 RepID=UPI000E6AC0A6|nr:hypothetical protein [Indioceanicola profundi]
MKHNLDILAVAVQLVRELGEDAVTHSRNRLVELIAVNHHRGATFWRQVMQACESELARTRAVMPNTAALARDPGDLSLPPSVR